MKGLFITSLYIILHKYFTKAEVPLQAKLHNMRISTFGLYHAHMYNLKCKYLKLG